MWCKFSAGGCFVIHVRRAFVVGLAAALWLSSAAAAPPKVLRVALPAAESGFDPARAVDIESRTITAHIFESLFSYDALARPVQLRPLVAEALPEPSENFRSWTVRLRRGVLFQDHPAFGGRPRELTAADFVYSLKRFADPALRSPLVGRVLELNIVGLDALREVALKTGKPFDYDRAIEGLQAPDRYTLRLRLASPRPRLPQVLAAPDIFGAVAREVVQAHGNEVDSHPIGTGPFRLAQWRRGSLIVLERNPRYRQRHYDAEPAADDSTGQAIAATLHGRSLPMVDRVEVAVIEAAQPRWLAFLNGELDHVTLPPDYAESALPGGVLAPWLARRGVQAQRTLGADASVTCFNLEHPVVGGYTPERVALRRAISLAVDIDSEVRVLRRGQAVPAQSMVLPHTSGYDPRFKSEASDHDPARARALLDLFGFVDRDGDGWREQPDGTPLVLEISTQSDATSRSFDEAWRRNLARVGLRVRFAVGDWSENLKAARAGRFAIWGLGLSAPGPDGQLALARLYGPQAGSENLARFRHAGFDEVYRQLQPLPDGPEREALFDRAKRIAVAYVPCRAIAHRITNDLTQPALLGYRRPVFGLAWWHLVDLKSTALAHSPQAQ